MTWTARPDEDTNADSALTFYSNKGKVIICTSLCLLVTVGGVVGVAASWRNDPLSLPGNFLAGIGALIMLALTIRYAAELFIPAPKLVISSHGMAFRTLVFGTVILAWHEIAGIGTYHTWFQEIMLIVTRDSRMVSRPRSRVGRALYAVLSKTTRAPLRVSDLLLAMSIKEIVAETQRRYGHELKQLRIEVRGG